MSYPNDYPSESMSTIWVSGSYTPHEVVKYIRDNDVPVDKASVRKSVGYQLSLVQNYVNSYYLGREDNRVTSGYFDYFLVGTGIADERFHIGLGTITMDDGMNLYEDQLYFKNNRPYAFYKIDEMKIDNNASSSDWEYVDLTTNQFKMFYIDTVVGPPSVETTMTLNSSGIKFIDYSNYYGQLNLSGTGDFEILANKGLYLKSPQVNINSPLIVPTSDSSRIDRIYNAQGLMTWSQKDPTVIDLDIAHTKDVSLVYFAVHENASTPVYSENWIPANYSPYPSGIPLMSGATTLSSYQPSTVPSPAYSGEYWKLQYGAHLLQIGSPTNWHIVISPINSTLEGLYGSTVQYRYTIIVFD